MNNLKKETLELNNELKRSIIRKRNCEANLLIQKYQKEQKQFKEPEQHLTVIEQPKTSYLFFATLFTLISVLEAICLIYAK
jgi:hypothetical protein